jgi:hypothetical protein
MKKTVLVVYSCDFASKKQRLTFEKEVRNDILIQDKNGICIEFYNEKDFDFLKIKFHSMLKKRKPDSTLFIDCHNEVMERVIRSIEERINEDVKFFFKNINLKGSQKATKILSVKEMALFMTAIKKKENPAVFA